VRRYATELVGTFFLTFTIGCTALAGNVTLAPLAIGATLMALVYAGGHISGGHFNPAVSLAVLLRGRLSPADLAGYWAAQLAGALLAAFAAWYVIDPGSTAALSFSGRDIGAALLAEFLFTFALAFVVLNVATSRENQGNSFYGLAIGFTVAAGAVAVGSLSGAAFNPAVAVAASVMGLFAWSALWIYLVATLLGATAAAFVYRYLNADDGPYFSPRQAVPTRRTARRR
jgi:aquaporin Z